ncbi:MAG TPA: ArsR family transcriptional regulator [Candidatus Acetothermia bacterium]|nr:ArsR family transcriptional regulator [Candidatus Acetothermia bacterium]
MNQAHAAEVFRALSVPNRMHILMLLKAKGPLPVKTIAETLELTSPAVSQHLKVLRQAGLVQAERQGYFVPYAVDDHALSDCCGMLVHMCAHPGHHGKTSECACKTEAERLFHRRERLLSELHRIETELEAFREQGE